MRVNTTHRGNELATSGRPVLALVGAPNSGKTTLYNWLTASHFRVVNYPGSTVEYAIGHAAARLGFDFHVIDTPGTYSLFPKSADEEVTLKALSHQHSVGAVTHVGVIVDGTQLERHLLLAKQVQETGLSMVLIVTMADLLRKSKLVFKKEILEREFGCPVILFDGMLGQGLKEIGQVVEQSRSGPVGAIRELKPWTDHELARRQESVQKLAVEAFADAKARQKGLNEIYERSLKMDRILLHPILGLILFFTIMASLFTSIYWLAKPVMELVDGAFSWGSDFVSGLGPDSILFQFLGGGLIKAFGSVLVFVPQIFILFVGIGILESTGYLARAATLIDRPFAKLGLSGRSFVPILSGFACAVPAMMATRNLSSKRDRWITNFVIPLMTCSARLPVYALLLGFLFADRPAWHAGLALAALYMAALVIGGLAAAVLNRILAKENHSFFMMELPLYRKPRYGLLLRQSLKRTQAYVKRAGPMIFVFAVLIWFGAHFPRQQSEPAAAANAAVVTEQNRGAAEVAPVDHTAESKQLSESYLGRAGHYLEPIVRPMGVDWRVGVGMLSAFAAREVFVSSMALIFNVAGEEDAQAEGLLKTMQDAKFPDGTLVFTTASVIGLIVFFMIALQCMSTFSIAIRESGSMKFAVGQLVTFNVIAYILALMVVQGLHAVGVA